MLVIQAVRIVRRLPFVIVVGLLLMAVAGVMDVLVHLAAVEDHAHRASSEGHVAHVIGIAGMTLVLVGVGSRGARRHRRSSAAHGGLDRNATR